MIQARPRPYNLVMERPCSCGGSNENCKWCNGSGSVPVIEGGPTVDWPTVIKPAAVKRVSGAKRRRSPYTGVPLVHPVRTQTKPITVSQAAPRADVRVEAGPVRELPLVARAGQTRFPKYRTPSGHQYERCGKCQMLVFAGKMADHDAGYHGGPWPGNRSSKSSKQRPRCPPGLTPCGVCGSPVRPDRLEAHLNRVHGGPSLRALR